MSDRVARAAAKLRDAFVASGQQVEAALAELFEAADADADRAAPPEPGIDPGSTRLGPVSTSGASATFHPGGVVSGSGSPFQAGGVVWGSGNPGGGDAVRAHAPEAVAPDQLRIVRNAAHDAVLAGVTWVDVEAAAHEGAKKALAARRKLVVVARIRARLRQYDDEVAPAIVDAMADDLAGVMRALHREGLLDG